MKKYILAAAMTAACGVTCFGQADENPNRLILHYLNGKTVTFDLGELDYMEFDREDPVPPAPADPKIGDYFYSDGTWSDGGLISIDADGCNAVWSTTRPAPLEGKTVVGIVFQTDPERISDEDKAAGFTHGYVIGCRNITDPKKSNYAKYPESVWFAGQYAKTDLNNVAKVASTCYQRINGSEETRKIIEGNDAEYYHEDIPMFYYGTEKYPVPAPEGTSGWFIPAIGQMWDCVANFCSGEVAAFLASNRETTSDFTYYVSKTDLSHSPAEDFMKVFELVPDSDKDEITIPDSKNILSLGTSSRYDEESRVIINLGMNGNGLVEGMAEWFDGEAHARPILAF